MRWLTKLLSADNAEVDFKAVLATLAFVSALTIYLAYSVKGLLVQWDMPAAVRDITVALILGGGTGAAATLLNKKLGVTDGDTNLPEDGNSPGNSSASELPVRTEPKEGKPASRRAD